MTRKSYEEGYAGRLPGYGIPVPVQYGAQVPSLWPTNRLAYVECGNAEMARLGFMSSLNGDAVTVAENYTLANTILGVARLVASAFSPVPPLSGLGEYEVIIRMESALISVNSRSNRGYPGDDEEADVGDFTVTVTAPINKLDEIFATINGVLKRETYAKIKWWYMGDGAESKTIYLPPLATTIRPEFYPDLHDPKKFLDDYMKSDASVLLMAGSPGTGKTTLLRHLICDRKLAAHVVYDERLMSNDKVFQSFLFGEGDIMVIEDADTILASREGDNNKLMARFLNVSDGLIKLPNKKLVFTTNISDFGRVDPALLRPGRCYAVLHTRPLNLDEAQAAARAANLRAPVDRGEYTLAQLFNQTAVPATVRTIGFDTQRAS